MAGLTAARALTETGATVELFDKGRGVGGRLSTRRREQGAFDHGAQRFSARSEPFAEEVRRWAALGVIAPTEPASEAAWWIPTPSASALPRHLAEGLSVRTSARVTGLARRNRRWWLALEGASEVGGYDVVIVTAPAPQAAALLGPHGVFERELAAIEIAPTWAVLALGEPGPGPIFHPSDEGPIELVARDERKPGREAGMAARLVAHASAAFSIAHLEASEAEVLGLLVPPLTARFGPVRHAQAHRWRFARVTRPLGEPALFDRARGLAIAGDGLLGPRIEAAWQSGRAVAEAIGR